MSIRLTIDCSVSHCAYAWGTGGIYSVVSEDLGSGFAAAPCFFGAMAENVVGCEARTLGRPLLGRDLHG